MISTNRILLGLALAAGLSGSAAPGESPAELAKPFLDDCARKAAAAETMTVPGKDGWLFFKGELRHLGAGVFWGAAAEKVAAAEAPDCKDPLPAIVHYKEQLDKLGIELILVPVPPKAVVYPEKLSDAVSVKEGQPPPRLDVHHQEFYRLLGEKGVKVLDLAPELIAHRQDQKGPMYCRTDTHWSGLACIRAAQLLARELQGRAWLKDLKKTRFDSEEKSVAVRGDLLAGLKAKPEPEKLLLRFVGTRSEAGLEPVKPDPASPVLLIADSHGLVFHIGEDLFAKGAGFADQLAFELGFPVDEIASRGDGATKVRIDLYGRAKAEPGWLAGKKLLVWCFSAREFTECTNGWRKLPVKKGG